MAKHRGVIDIFFFSSKLFVLTLECGLVKTAHTLFIPADNMLIGHSNVNQCKSSNSLKVKLWKTIVYMQNTIVPMQILKEYTFILFTTMASICS